MMTLLIEFLGCKVNSYEVEAVAQDFFNHGFRLFDEKVDTFPSVVIINTCAVTETSVTKDKKMIRHYKKIYPEAVLCVMGCYSQYKGEYILNSLGADIVIGTSNRSKLYSLYEEFIANKKKVYLHDENNKITNYEDMHVNKFLFNTRAYVKIQDGCNNFCTYCLIPYIRGRSRSREKEDIVSEIKRLINNGHKEIVLTGVDMSSYGLDLKEKTTFSDLLEYILVNVSELYRLRISSLEESLLDDKFLSLLAKYDSLANHLHIPLQSGSKEVVKRMNRKYDLESFKEKVKRIRELRKGISITTDVIVGFPGESEENFLETFNSCKEINFSKIHVFPYSDREGTIASKMKDKISPEVKKERVHRLLDLSNELEENYSKNFYGQEIEFLFEEYDPKLKAYKGHSSNYLECFVSSDTSLQGQVKRVIYTKENAFHF